MAKNTTKSNTLPASKAAPKNAPKAAPAPKQEAPKTEAAAPKVTVTKVPEARHAPTTAKLEWKVTANCKRPGSASHDRASLYWGKTTVADYLAAGATRADLAWDADHGFFTIKV